MKRTAAIFVAITVAALAVSPLLARQYSATAVRNIPPKVAMEAVCHCHGQISCG
jgi:hypothetical protein